MSIWFSVGFKTYLWAMNKSYSLPLAWWIFFFTSTLFMGLHMSTLHVFYPPWETRTSPLSSTISNNTHLLGLCQDCFVWPRLFRNYSIYIAEPNISILGCWVLLLNSLISFTSQFIKRPKSSKYSAFQTKDWWALKQGPFHVVFTFESSTETVVYFSFLSKKPSCWNN